MKQLIASILALLIHAHAHAGLTISVAAGNSSGISDPVDGGEDPGPNSFDPNPSHYLADLAEWNALRTPSIIRADRITTSKVQVEWSCPKTGYANPSAVKITIMRQAHDGEWVQVDTRPFAEHGSFTDLNAPVAKTYRYSAYSWISVVGLRNGAIIHTIHASNGAKPKMVEYHPATVRTIGYRATSNNYPQTAPHGGLPTSPGGGGSGDDNHTFSLGKIGLNGCSFVNGDTVMGMGVFEWNDQHRWYGPTKAATDYYDQGFIVYGENFPMTAKVLVRDTHYSCGAYAMIDTANYAGQFLGLTGDPKTVDKNGTPPDPWLFSGSAYLYMPPFRFGEKSEVNQPRPKVPPVPPLPQPPQDLLGFDNTTFFAQQHIPIGETEEFSTREMKLMTPEGAMFASGKIPVAVIGPITFKADPEEDPPHQLANALEMPFKVIATGDGEGMVVEQNTKKELRTVGLPSRTQYVALYRVNVVANNFGGDPIVYEGVTPPEPAAMQDELNKIYLPQTNVGFIVVNMGDITINTSNFDPPSESPKVDGVWKSGTANMRRALVEASDSLPPQYIALYYMPELDPNVGGQSFDVPGKGALLCTPINRWTAAAHELGHCMGLEHAWTDRVQGQGTPFVMDAQEFRLMGYRDPDPLNVAGDGKILRHAEIMMVNAFTPESINPYGN